VKRTTKNSRLRRKVAEKDAAAHAGEKKEPPFPDAKTKHKVGRYEKREEEEEKKKQHLLHL